MTPLFFASLAGGCSAVSGVAFSEGRGGISIAFMLVALVAAYVAVSLQDRRAA